MKYLVILRGPHCSGKTEVSEKLKERLDEIKHKNMTYLLKLDEINNERFVHDEHCDIMEFLVQVV